MNENNAKKVTVTIRADLLERMDEYADSNGMTRSGLIGLSVEQYLNAAVAVPKLSGFLDKLAAMVDGVAKGEITESDAKSRLEDLERARYEFEQLSLK